MDGFKWRIDRLLFDEKFMQDYDENNEKAYILEVDLKYVKNLRELHNDLLVLPQRMKIEKYGTLVCNVCDKKIFVIYIKALKKALDHGLILKKYTG